MEERRALGPGLGLFRVLGQCALAGIALGIIVGAMLGLVALGLTLF